MLFRPQPEQLDFIVLFSLVVLGFGVVAILVAAAAAANPVLDAVADAVSVFGRVAVGRRRMGQRVTQGGCAGHKGVDVRRQGFSLAGPQPGALDDGAIFAREDQGRLHAWARGQVGQQGRDMLRNLLRRRKSAITTHDIVLLNESHRLTAVWAILLAGRVEAGQRRRANTSCSQLSSLMAHRRSGSQAEDRQAVLRQLSNCRVSFFELLVFSFSRLKFIPCRTEYTQVNFNFLLHRPPPANTDDDRYIRPLPPLPGPQPAPEQEQGRLVRPRAPRRQQTHHRVGAAAGSAGAGGGAQMSWTYLHNESGNIYSHLIPAIAAVFGHRFLYQYLRNEYANLHEKDWRVISLQLWTVLVCLSTSTLYHTMTNHSPRVAHKCLLYDYMGIITVMLGNFISGIYFGFYCEPRLRLTYWTLISVLGLVTGVILLTPKFHGPQWRRFRLNCFILTGFSAFAPIGHGTLRWGMEFVRKTGVPYYFAEGALVLIGCYFYEAGRKRRARRNKGNRLRRFGWSVGLAH
ncbi:Hemolysin-III family protein [Rasamsonia emersonii CBS 393.64]|uniref:Hemolysin-III family protein n=1 Tax=Rasamsonia emersonii (strain ATCC 16479 / CBS 393.64 / IMI 116815) TaxID=1408163 RepID=A0A0F4Z3N8_RASE3|nr:Hemolysin-III family protein [Rasamsonia emersonii CBS 393.64]KKA24513.1 Hemolysin-III family protein [Rasamsonia emersonii CBS 393.64]